MKNYFLLVVLTMLQVEVFGQPAYVPFPEGDAVWHIGQKDPSWIVANQEQYMYAGDTVMTGYSYHKLSYKVEWVHLPDGALISDDNGIVGYIRQDSLQKKVYYVPHDEMQEYLLYDFALQVGDSVPLTYSHPNEPKLMVIQKDSVLIGSSFRSRFTLYPSDNGGNFDTVKIIEGIGSLGGLVTYFGSICFEYCEWLACFQQDGETIYSSENFISGFPFGFCHIVGINSPIISLNAFHLYPNLVTKGAIVNITGNISKKLNVLIYDLRGKLILDNTYNHISDMQIETSGFQKGMYIVTMTPDNDLPVNATLVIQ